MTRIVGYTREFVPGTAVLTDSDELRRAGAVKVFADRVDADRRARPALKLCLRSLEPGDTLVVTSAARLSHGLAHFTSIRTDLTRRGIRFLSLTEPGLSSGGGPVDPDDVLIALDAFRRRLVSVRTREGMESAAVEGRHAGRPSVMTEERIAIAIARELRGHDRSYAHIGRVLGVSTGAVQRALTPRTYPPPGDG